jgi:hypothetical protein
VINVVLDSADKRESLQQLLGLFNLAEFAVKRSPTGVGHRKLRELACCSE